MRTAGDMGSAVAAKPIAVAQDVALLMPIQIAMLVRLSTLHGRDLTADLVAKLLGSPAARMAVRFALEQTAKLIPGRRNPGAGGDKEVVLRDAGILRGRAYGGSIALPAPKKKTSA